MRVLLCGPMRDFPNRPGNHDKQYHDPSRAEERTTLHETVLEGAGRFREVTGSRAGSSRSGYRVKGAVGRKEQNRGPGCPQETLHPDMAQAQTAADARRMKQRGGRDHPGKEDRR